MLVLHKAGKENACMHYFRPDVKVYTKHHHTTRHGVGGKLPKIRLV